MHQPQPHSRIREAACYVFVAVIGAVAIALFAVAVPVILALWGIGLLGLALAWLLTRPWQRRRQALVFTIEERGGYEVIER